MLPSFVLSRSAVPGLTPQSTLTPSLKRTLQVASIGLGTRKAASVWVFLAFLALDREKDGELQKVSVTMTSLKHSL